MRKFRGNPFPFHRAMGLPNLLACSGKHAKVQLLVPPSMRATTSASFLLINNLIGIGFGVWIFGEISTRVEATYGNESLRYAVIYGLAFYVLAAGFYLLAAPRLKRDIAAVS